MLQYVRYHAKHKRKTLVGLFNRRSYETYIMQQLEMMKPFKIVYMDLDHFKLINDLHGHVIGDYILKTFSALLKEVFNEDLCSRLDGDEFMVVTDFNLDVEERIKMLQDRISTFDHEIVRTVKFSYGIQRDESGVTIDELYNLVDKKMYVYKKQNKTLKRRKTD